MKARRSPPPVDNDPCAFVRIEPSDDLVVGLNRLQQPRFGAAGQVTRTEIGAHVEEIRRRCP
jgi:hypothetical protein